MFKNYLKIALRNIRKNRGMFSINIIGLTLGISSCLLIMLFVIDELSYDTFNEKADEIVRVVLKAKIENEDIREAVVMAPVAQTLKQEFPEVLDATRLQKIHNPSIQYDNVKFNDASLAYVDSNFFDVFTMPIIKGAYKNPLDAPYSVVITEELAFRYFGDENPIGKALSLNQESQPYRVSAVMKNIPKNAHFHFDAFISMQGLSAAKNNSWTQGNFHTYLELKKGTSQSELESKLPAVVEKNMGPQLQEEIGVSYAEFSKENPIGLFLQPLTSIHLNSEFTKASTLEEGGDIKYIYIFSAIALFMLLIACINFMNLSTASASKRAKEIGIRKVLGSRRKQLANQFLMESFLATLIAMLLAVILVAIVMPYFNTISGKELELTYLFSPKLIMALLVGTLIISLLAGSYPTIFLSSFKPVTALKNKFSGSGKTKGLRSGLVVFQFVISAALILGTLVVNQQMSYIQNKSLGYDKNEILVLRDAYLLGENNRNALKNELIKNSKVEHVSVSGFVPAGPSNNSISAIHKNGKFIRRSMQYNIDEAYINVMGITLLEGRNFSNDFGYEQDKVILNESAVKAFGLGKNPLGKSFERATENGNETVTVIGIVKDFHHESLHKTIEPLIMNYGMSGGLIVRAKMANMKALIADAQQLWNSFNTDEVFSYALLDESYRYTYVAEQKMGTVLNIFAILTVLVACMGLFGLVTFTAEQRFKEIGIRKVLGSSVYQIVTMLSKDFLKLIGISFLVAFPLGYYLMNTWLESFAYHIKIEWWLFALAAAFTVLIALITISYKSLNAALQNPIKSLQTE
jgi:putative ABC transport system permease protein